MDINELLNTNLQQLCAAADAVRAENVGDVIHCRALLEISNICRRNCSYCGLRAQNANLQRYAMSIAEIEAQAMRAVAAGYKTIVLQSGEAEAYDIGEFCEMVSRIVANGAVVTLSLGELPRADLARLRVAGASRYLLKFETADSELYNRLHKGYSLQQRLRCLSNIKDLGYEVGSGFLVGLPSETQSTLVQNLKLMKEFECDMVGIGVFIPHPHTPLAQAPKGSVLLAKKCMACTRLLLPKCNIPITTSVGEYDGIAMFNGGANVIMQNITPQNLACDYQIYPKSNGEINIEDDRQKLVHKIAALGRCAI